MTPVLCMTCRGDIVRDIWRDPATAKFHHVDPASTCEDPRPVSRWDALPARDPVAHVIAMDDRGKFVPSYSPWRHGGNYVDSIRYPSGAVGCVGKADGGRWVVACVPDLGDFRTRDAAARAEWAHVATIWENVRAAILAQCEQDGRDAFAAGDMARCPYPAPATPVRSPESRSWLMRGQAWSRGWHAANIADMFDPLDSVPA